MPAPSLMFESDSIAGNDGDAIATWPDTSGAGRNATQAVAGSKPSLQTNELNGLQVVRFDADYLETASLLGSDIFSAQQCVIFVVQKQDGANAQNTPFSWDQGGGGLNRVSAHLSYDNVLYWDYPDAFGTGRISVAQPSGWDDAWHITCLYRDTNVSRIYVDGGTPIVTGTPSGSLTLTSSAAFRLGIGPGLGAPLKGDMAQLRVYKETLSLADIDIVGNILKTKYGLTWTNLTSPPPVRFVPWLAEEMA